jgi:hypothetical protein
MRPGNMSDAINGIRIGYFGAGLAGGYRLISVSYLSNSLLDKLHLFANAQYHQKLALAVREIEPSRYYSSSPRHKDTAVGAPEILQLYFLACGNRSAAFIQSASGRLGASL